MTSSVKYIHNEKTHNATDPGILVPMLIEMFHPASVADVGCGTGNFLYAFKKNGVNDVIGFDGMWANKELLSRHLEANEFVTIDLEGVFPVTSKKYDIVLNLEVAEHVSAERSANLIDFLTGLSDTVVFSAAIPGQGGFNHVNEQWEEYWDQKFIDKGYQKYDIIRHKIIPNKAIAWWYRQNMIVYSKKDLSHLPSVPLNNVIMREHYEIKMKHLHNRSSILKRLLGKLK